MFNHISSKMKTLSEIRQSYHKTRGEDRVVFMFIAIFTVAVLLVTSFNSYLFKPWIHYDVTCSILVVRLGLTG